MKVCNCPTEVPAPVIDFSKGYDFDKVEKAEKKHCDDLKAWLLKSGYTGKNTGKIFRHPMADGYAQYMIADGSKFCLIHLPYGDAWDSRDVSFLTKKEILKRIESNENIAKLFASK